MLAMDAFRANFPELFSCVIGYLYPIDLIALGLTSRQYVDCIPKEFSSWRRNIAGVNLCIKAIKYEINPSKYVYAYNHDIFAGVSSLENGGKRAVYSYSGSYKRVATYCSSHCGDRFDQWKIRDGGRITHSVAWEH